MNLITLTMEERIEKVKEIFAYAAGPGVTVAQIAKTFDMNPVSVSRLLNGHIHKDIVEMAGVTCHKRRNMSTSRKPYRLTLNELEEAMRTVNGTYILSVALRCNPYQQSREPFMYAWIDHLIRTLFFLKEEKPIILERRKHHV